MDDSYTPFNITMVIKGNPVPKGRPRFTKTGHTFTPAKTREYEQYIKKVIKEKMNGKPPLTGALTVSLSFRLNPPKAERSRLKNTGGADWHTKRPDLDNFIKAALDGLNGVAFIDDSQICKIYAEKHISLEPPQLFISIRRL
jgi:Holliday junction resolvase RusA-like endonuclease